MTLPPCHGTEPDWVADEDDDKCDATLMHECAGEWGDLWQCDRKPFHDGPHLSAAFRSEMDVGFSEDCVRVLWHDKFSAPS